MEAMPSLVFAAPFSEYCMPSFGSVTVMVPSVSASTVSGVASVTGSSSFAVTLFTFKRPWYFSVTFWPSATPLSGIVPKPLASPALPVHVVGFNFPSNTETL